ncbi:YciI family protein [Gryllotalpicola ginsengisoli]|uniref:YciI family protein n=1 Tax=Gryllotalpicola ginsengisoli TaxID=444608 RepID=UPI0003B6E1AF|nr:YciI family protein [Gryllotalpicola ginsengisoli]
MPKYMLILRTVDEAVAQQAMADAGMDLDKMVDTMSRYNEQLFEAGVLVGMEGLDDTESGSVIDYSSTPPVVTDGPYGETKELFWGFWIIDVPSKEAALEWAVKAPLGPGTNLEVRRVGSLDDVAQDNEWIRKDAQWRRELARRAAVKAGVEV